MKIKNTKTYYKRFLPHIHPIGATFFVTFRLKGSLPKHILSNLRTNYENNIIHYKNIKSLDNKTLLYNEQKRYFKQFDELLNQIKTGPHYLKNPKIADIIKNQLHIFDKKLYDLVAYCIMSNHVHILIDTSIQIEIDSNEESFFEPLQNIMKRIKGPTALYANRVLAKKGGFLAKRKL